MSVNDPSSSVELTDFFPVSEFAAVIVTPGSGTFPVVTFPVISQVAEIEADPGEPGKVACAHDNEPSAITISARPTNHG